MIHTDGRRTVADNTPRVISVPDDLKVIVDTRTITVPYTWEQAVAKVADAHEEGLRWEALDWSGFPRKAQPLSDETAEEFIADVRERLEGVAA